MRISSLRCVMGYVVVMLMVGLTACSARPIEVEKIEDEVHEEEPSEHISLSVEPFGVNLELPPSYGYGTAGTANDGEEPLLFAGDALNNHVEVFLRDMSVEPVLQDDEAWAQAYAKSVRILLDAKQEPIETLEVRPAALSGMRCASAYAVSGNIDSQSFREYLFIVKDGKGLCVGLTTRDRASLESLESALNIVSG